MRWIVRILGIFVVLIVGAVAAFFLLPADRIGAFVEERFEASTGRALSIQGDVRPGLWPEIGIKTGPVTIANADWAGDTPMVEAEGLSVGVAWQGLFGGDIRVTGVELIRPTIRLVQNADGQANWDLGSTSLDSTDTAAAGSSEGSETATT